MARSLSLFPLNCMISLIVCAHVFSVSSFIDGIYCLTHVSVHEISVNLKKKEYDMYMNGCFWGIIKLV